MIHGPGPVSSNLLPPDNLYLFRQAEIGEDNPNRQKLAESEVSPGFYGDGRSCVKMSAL